MSTSGVITSPIHLTCVTIQVIFGCSALPLESLLQFHHVKHICRKKPTGPADWRTLLFDSRDMAEYPLSTRLQHWFAYSDLCVSLGNQESFLSQVNWRVTSRTTRIKAAITHGKNSSVRLRNTLLSTFVFSSWSILA